VPDHAPPAARPIVCEAPKKLTLMPARKTTSAHRQLISTAPDKIVEFARNARTRKWRVSCDTPNYRMTAKLLVDASN
jgi:hypothetical protein